MRLGIPAGKEGTAGCAPTSMVVAGVVWMAPVPVRGRGETVVVAASGSARPVSVAVFDKEATAKEVSVRTNEKSELMDILLGAVEGC